MKQTDKARRHRANQPLPSQGVKHKKRKKQQRRKPIHKRPTNPQPEVRTYGDRNELLKTMGYDSYKAYLNSPLWADIRKRAYYVHGSLCRLCDAPATVIHHIGYGKSVLEGRTLHQLAPLCVGCHAKVEFRKGQRKRSMAEALVIYHRLWRKVKSDAKATDDVEVMKQLFTRCKQCGNPAKRQSQHCRPCDRLLRNGLNSREQDLHLRAVVGERFVVSPSPPKSLKEMLAEIEIPEWMRRGKQ